MNTTEATQAAANAYDGNPITAAGDDPNCADAGAESTSDDPAPAACGAEKPLFASPLRPFVPVRPRQIERAMRHAFAREPKGQHIVSLHRGPDRKANAVLSDGTTVELTEGRLIALELWMDARYEEIKPELLALTALDILRGSSPGHPAFLVLRELENLAHTASLVRNARDMNRYTGLDAKELINLYPRFAEYCNGQNPKSEGPAPSQP